MENSSMDKELMQILACPACRGELEPLAESDPVRPDPAGLACPACALVYPVRDHIPVLLREEAVPRLEWNAGKRCARPEKRKP
jgi:uncharacterized protein YbaR (Trm112 family)